ncbi:fibronectin type III domain-containing protein [Euzebyella saccharophila]|uniref:Fibronectin type III domain-containing protein n=1 Tax=Euzebyella saccharophila TaxID=679664 RepID=A0ABV8JN42_9FLAO|nr:fibronectin type III domain-containing protein [Euzebyella saccharophila]
MIFKTLKHIIQKLHTAYCILPTAYCLLHTALCLLFLTFNLTTATAQSFPVQVIPQVTPPPPIYFSEYANENTVNSPLRVQLILNDFEIVNREVRLRVSFEGSGISFQSKDLVTGASPLFLEGGVPLVLTNVELASYFRYENLNGISGNVYGNAIPEGAYNFCFEVFDVLTGSRLSQKSCAISVVFQNEPPFLVSPRNKTNVEEINPQNIVFQWTPRHVNVSNVEYELSIVEIWDTQVDPQQAFLSSPPVFQTVTNATTYVYGPADPLFLSGKNYAWRVQAKAKQGLEEVGLFENQGYSEIYSFSYAGSCDLPLGINHEVKGSTNANIFWDDFSTEVPEYTVRYRQKNVEGAEWFPNKTSGNQTTLWDLKPGTVYEYQVQKQCTVTGSDWSVTKQFTTFIADEEAAVYDCNITPNFNLSNKEPLPNLYAGDAFKAGDFPIKVLETSGSNGRFTGKGYVTIPYLNSIRVGVAFTNVLVNTDNQLVEGSVVTVYDPSMRNILDIDEAIDTVTDAVDAVGEFVEGDNDLDEIKVNWAIDKDDIKIEDGKVVITNPQNGVTKSEPLGDDMVITDSEGKTYYVDAEGEITEGGTIDQNGAITGNNVEGVSNNGRLESLTARGIQVTFNEEGTYGMDIMPTGNIGTLAQEYTVIKDADGKDYPLTHHAVKKGATTKIKATIDLKNGDYKADDVSFKTKQGDSIPTTFNGSTATLTLTGRYSFENEVIYATVPSKEDNSKQLTAGAFTLWHLTERSINVALVSVNGASLGNIESNVSKIFEKAVANIQFGKSLSLSVKKSELGSNQTLDFGESAWAAAYNEEQKMLVNRVKQLEGYNANTYYILVFNDIEPSRPIGGFMPLQRQMGFVFGGKPEEEDKGGDKSKTLAHEIGHGIFALQHPFSEFGTNQQTDWLMDYGSGDQLPHTHWAQIHDPSLKFYLFQEEEEGEIAGKIWFTPDWKPFSYSKEISRTIASNGSMKEPKGTIPGFKLGDITYYATYDNGKFVGYVSSQTPNGQKVPLPYVSIQDIKKEKRVFLFDNSPECNDPYYSVEYKDLENFKNGTINFNHQLVKYEGETDCIQEDQDAIAQLEENPFNLTICQLINTDGTYKEEWVTQAANSINEAYGRRIGQKSKPYRTKGDFYHLVNVSNAALADKAELIEDKLYTLKYKTDKDFYVVFQPVEYKIDENKLDEFASKILEKSNLKDYSNNAILIVVPFIRFSEGLGTTKCMQVGFAQSKNDLVDTFQFKKSNDLLSYILGAFARIKKPATIYYSYILADRKNAIVEKSSDKDVRGLSFIQNIAILKSPHYDELRKLESQGRQLKREKPKSSDYNSTSEYVNAKYEHQQKLAQWHIAYENKQSQAAMEDFDALEEAKSDKPDKTISYFEAVPGKKGILFREVYIDRAAVNSKLLIAYSNLHQAQDEYAGFLVNLAYLMEVDEFAKVQPFHLYQEIDTDAVVYSVLDAASLALAPFQIDFIADGIGLIYAVANGHRTEAGLYTASLVAVGFGQYAATYLRSSDRFTLVAKLDNNGNVTEYEIKRANEIIESANEKPMMSSVADNLDDAKKDFNDALDVDFGLEMALDIEAATATGANTVVDIAEGAIESLNEVKAILEAANVSGPALAKFENIDAVQSIANRFKSTKGDGLEGIKNLLLDSKTNTRKQEIVDQLVKIDEIFPTTALITITTKKSGNFNFIQIKDPADNLVAQMTGGNITKRQILENGDKIASYDGIDILKNGDIIGFKGYANWPYDKYVPNGALTKISDGSSSYKDVYSIAGEPDIVLAVMQPGKNVQTLINEVEALAKLKAQEIPAVEVLEQVIYEGRPAIIMKRYAGSSDNIAQLRGATVEIIGSSDAVTANSIESLETIKDLLKQKEVDVVDLEFLIDDNGSFFIADPSAIRLNTQPSEGNINLIDELIAQIKVNLVNAGGSFKTVTKTIVKQELPTDFVNALKKFGKTEDEILDYFKNYHNVRSGENWLNEIQTLKAQYPNLSNDEVFSLWGYTTNFYYGDLNYWLRNGLNSNLTGDVKLILENALAKLPNYSGQKVYRGIEIKQADLQGFLDSYNQGAKHTWNDFTSCGGSQGASFGGRPEINIIFEIQHTTGKNITDFADGVKYNNMPAPEILIKSGSKFEAVADPVLDQSTGKWIIKLIQNH